VRQLSGEGGLWCACSRWITEKTMAVAEACAIDVVVWHNVFVLFSLFCFVFLFLLLISQQ
jgi:hypothetical protein